MIRPFTQASSARLVFLVLALGFMAGARAQTPSAEEILRTARVSPMSKQANLRAQLVGDAGKTPFTISLDQGVVTYAFTNPDQQIQLVLSADDSELRERRGGRTAEVKPARFDEKIRDTPITYEDLSMRFLYWPHPKLVGTDVVALQKAWKIEVQAPRGQSQYGAARLWIGQDSGALLKIEGYDANGRPIKRFTVISGQKINGQWMLKSMRLEPLDPATGKVIDRDRMYLKVLGDAG
jgi:hypothetical protein